MKAGKILILLLVLIAVSRVCAQTQRLKIGDSLPQLDHLAEWKSGKEVNLKQFKGKLLILDFFSMGCVPCIKAIPAMEELQKRFEDKIKIFIVSLDSKENLIKYGSTSKAVNKTNLPIIENGKALREYFGFQTVPTHVWIDPTGVIRFITNGESTTEANLLQFFKNNPISLESVQSEITIEQPLWQNLKKIQQEEVCGISTLTKSILGAVRLSKFLTDSVSKKTVGYRALNYIPTDIIKESYWHEHKELTDWKRVLIKVSDSTKYVWPKENAGKWALEHEFCYEINVSSDRSDSLRSFIRADMKRYFNLKGTVKMVKTKCLVLTLVDSLKLKTRGLPPSFNYDRENEADYTFTNTPFKKIFDVTVGNPNRKYPCSVFNETHFSGKADIEIRGDINDLEHVKKELPKWGLQLKEEERTIKMLVITDL